MKSSKIYQRLRQPFGIAALLTLATLLIVSAFRVADDPFTTQLIERLTSYTRERPAEKTYLLTDRDQYLPGETVWLCGYLADAQTNGVDTVSKVLYVDLIDLTTRRVVTQAWLRNVGGQAPGSLPLPDSLRAGSYQLRAYTNWMRNFSDAFFFTKTLTLIRPDQPVPAPTSAPASALDVQFLPEGGQLIAGLPGRVAFKAVGSDGQGTAVEGFVLGPDNDTLTAISTQHLGMGFFNLTVNANQQLTAYIRRPGEPFTAYPLPVARPQGYALTVDNLSNAANVRAIVGAMVPDTTAGKLTLVAQNRGQIVHVAKLPANRKLVVVPIPRASLSDGVVQLTLFDNQNRPVAERLLYIAQNQSLAIAFTPNKTTYKPRERVDLNLRVTNAAGQPVAANLSLAVTDASQRDLDTNALTLPAHYLLTSDLGGTIEQPGYYFDTRHADRIQKLDLLLMTQGWRRFTWFDVLAGSLPPPRFALETGLSLSGQALRAGSRKAVGKVRLTFMAVRRDSTREIFTGESDDAGNFAAYGLDFTDTTSVMIQAIRNKNDRNLVLTLDQLITPPVTLTKIPFRSVVVADSELAELLKRTNEYLEIERQIRRNREVLLNEVTVRAKREPARDARKIYSEPDATVKFDQSNTAGAVSILDVIRGRVAGVQVTGSGLNASVQIRGAANFGGPIAPLFVLDGMPTQPDIVQSIAVQDVEQIDVLKGPSAAIYGSQAAGGVIIILTKRGSPNYSAIAEPAPGALVTKIPGYQPARQFYAPRYDVAKPEHIRPDYRATLHWQPTIKTDADGRATVTFWASDARSKLHVIVEGVSLGGQPGAGRSVVVVN